MTAITHPSADQFDRLIQGTLPSGENEELTRHLEECESCQDRLQQMATGEIAINDLVHAADQLSPPGQSAYWPAVTKVQAEIAGQLSNDREETPLEGSQSLSDTKSGLEVKPFTAAPVLTPELDFLEPTHAAGSIGRLQHFEIYRIVGRGGMGVVLEGFDTHLQRRVAIKVLNPQFQQNEIARQRFCREGRAAAAIAHEHVVAMHQVAKATDGGIAFLVMQYIDGETLESRMASVGTMPPGEVARLGMQIASGLAAAHADAMVHRDIKPANVLIERTSDRVKLTDFGLARSTNDIKLTKTGMVTGTPLYMSPEQTMGQTADERSDLFSLGAVLYEMATGVAPFQDASALGVMKRIVDHHPTPPAKLESAFPKPLSDLIMSLLQKKPEDRPKSAAVVASALSSTAQSLGTLSPMQVPVIPASEAGKLSGHYSRIGRRWMLAASTVAAVGLFSLLVALVLLLRSPQVGDALPSVLLPGNPGTVWSVDFTSDGKRVIAAIEDGSVRVWDIGDQKLEKSFNAHRGIVWVVTESPDGSMIVTSGDDGYVKLWDAETLELQRDWKVGNAVRGLSISPDGTRIAAGDRDGEIKIYSVLTGELLRSVAQPGSILGLDFSADGKQIASVGSDKLVRIWNADSFEIRQTLSGHDGPIYNVAFAESGSQLASVGWKGNVILWDADTGQLVRRLSGSQGDVWGVSFCVAGTHLVTGDQTGAAHVWDLTTGRSVATLRGHSSAVHNISLDPTAHRIATSSRDGTIRVWDTSGLVH